MAIQSIDTERVASSIASLRAVNGAINDAFDTMQKKAQQLDSAWNSKAGETAKTTMYQIFKNSDTRSAVIQNYINLLEQQVDPGYINTETVNTQLADQFK